MNYGMYLSASGMFAAMHRMDTAANNLANTETAGFKPDLETVMARDACRIEDGCMNLPSNEMLEKLGGGVSLGATRVQFKQGILESTKNPLDVAINGEGFLAVQGPDGEGQRLTRDGRMMLNQAGELVQTATGRKVLNESGGVITLDPHAPVSIDADGGVHQKGEVTGKIAVLDVADRRNLKKEGLGLYRVEGNASPEKGTGEVVQRSVERSAVDAVKAMLDISAAQRDIESGAKMIQIHDEIMGRTIGTFGRPI